MGEETSGGSGREITGSSTYHFVHPGSFLPTIVPEAERRPYARTLCLPQVYDDALKQRVREMQEFHRMLADVSDEDRRKRVQQQIQGHFREWLMKTGKARHIMELAKMASGDSGRVG